MTGYQTGPGNQLLNGGLWTYTFDSEGNEIQKTSGSGEKWKYSYDLLNHLTSAIDINSSGVTVTYATYVYDVFGNMIEKDVWTQQSGQTTVNRFGYDIAEPPALAGGLANTWADLNSSNALQTRYLRGDDISELFARISAAGVAGWYLADHLGSVRNLTDNSGTMIDTIAYDAYGKINSESNPSNDDRFKWAELQYDAATGLNFAKARPEDPATGRWLEQDPIGFSAGDWNLYRYTNNGPTNFIDPTGLKINFTPGIDKIFWNGIPALLITARIDPLAAGADKNGAEFEITVTEDNPSNFIRGAITKKDWFLVGPSKDDHSITGEGASIENKKGKLPRRAIWKWRWKMNTKKATDSGSVALRVKRGSQQLEVRWSVSISNRDNKNKIESGIGWIRIHEEGTGRPVGKGYPNNWPVPQWPGSK